MLIPALSCRVASPIIRALAGHRSASIRSFHSKYSVSWSEKDPFGLDSVSNSNEPIKFRVEEPLLPLSLPDKQSPSNSSRASGETKPSSTVAFPSVGSSIFRRMTQNRQSQLQELRRFDEQPQRERDESATADQIWSSISQLKVQSHSGPLTPASSRVVRTTRAPPTSFLSRPIAAADFERAYKKLQATLNAAGLKKEINLNRRYEKPFLKRRRLRSERHRRRFAIEVQRRVQTICVMRLKGM